MKLKNIFNKKKRAPRELEAITKEYAEVLSEAAKAQYLVYIYTKQLAQINARLEEINLEENDRRRLADKAAATEVQTNEVQNG